MLNLVETFFFWLGVGAAAWRWPTDARLPAFASLAGRVAPAGSPVGGRGVRGLTPIV